VLRVTVADIFVRRCRLGQNKFDMSHLRRPMLPSWQHGGPEKMEGEGPESLKVFSQITIYFFSPQKNNTFIR